MTGETILHYNYKINEKPRKCIVGAVYLSQDTKLKLKTTI